MANVENSNRELIIRVKEKSEDDFEKNITYISAGTLILSLTFIEKIITLKDSTGIGYLITAWILLALTLLINLISHQISSYYHDKTLDECDNAIIGVGTNINRRNRKMRTLNVITICTLIIGILFLILYCSKNALNMKDLDRNSEKQIQPTEDKDLIIKGRTITTPAPINSTTQSTPTTSNPTTSSDSTNPSKTTKQ